jgi:hypothetical protein
MKRNLLLMISLTLSSILLFSCQKENLSDSVKHVTEKDILTDLKL